VRSYSQFCPLATGLDLVGERWTLLIVRELGIRPARYSDLREALPGMATNLLAKRLRTLLAGGVIDQRTTPAPTVATIYVLSEWGRELYDVVLRLGRWGARTLLTQPAERDFRARYAIPVVQALYALDADLDGLEPLTIRVDSGAEAAHVTVSAIGVDAAIDEEVRPADVVLDGPPAAILGLLAGVIDPDDADGFRADRTAKRRFRALTRRAVGSARAESRTGP